MPLRPRRAHVRARARNHAPQIPLVPVPENYDLQTLSSNALRH